MKNTVQTNYQVVMINELCLGDYQRSVKTQKIKEMNEKFDANLLGTITVSRRDGLLYVIDGQHRVALARIKGLKALMALVYEGLTYEEEAEYFNKLNGANGEKTRLTTGDIFHANVEAKDEGAVEIKNMIEKVGFKIAKANGKNIITAVGEVQKIYNKFGGQHLFESLALIKETWNGETYSLNNLMLRGVSEFLKIYSKELDFSTQTFVKQLSKIKPIKLVREMKADTTTDKSAVKAMNTLLFYYNKSLRTKKLENKHFNL